MKTQNSMSYSDKNCNFRDLVQHIFLLCSYLLIGMNLVGCGGNQENKPHVTTLNALLENVDHDCSDALLDIGNELIGSKKSFLQLETLDNTYIDTEKEDTASHVDMASPLNIRNNPLIVSGMLKYNDRPAHLNFDAYSIDATNNQCVVRYQLDYHFTQPCMVIREEAFKKWNQIGILGEHTRLYVHKRKPNRKAYLTDLERNIQCLVSVRGLQMISK